MRKKQRRAILLKGFLASCLIFNQLSGFTIIAKAASVNNQSLAESFTEENQLNESNNLDSDNQHLIDTNEEEIIDSSHTETSEVEKGENTEDEVNNKEESISNHEEENRDEPQKSPTSEVEDNLDKNNNGEEIQIVSEEETEIISESRSIGSGLVQLWQVVPEGQNQEGKTTSEIMKALQCRPNHNLYPLNGQSQHQTYVNSCYVDDALYLGEDNNYYYIYLSGYEGKVPKSETHIFSLDLNGDKKYVDYKIQTVAYYVPGSTVKAISDDAVIHPDAPELNYYDQHLNKYSEAEEVRSIDWYSAATVQSPSYYANDNGTLVHYVTNNVRVANKYSKVIVGKAPSWMSTTTKYYSYDGIYFYTNWTNIRVNGQGAVNQNNPFYNYYQYLPFRSKTNYSANTIDSYTTNNGGSGGKLVSTGKYFYAVQDKYGINGALQYAMGIHESGWGKSSLSINKNNLFGMNATDNNPYGNGTSFPTVEAGINYHADRYLSWGYTDPIDDYRYFGSHVGNKGSGMNVKYASDPFWGEKIAGWYYRFDNSNGMKDYNYYSIGIKQSNAVIDVKSQANSSSKTLYQTKNKRSNLIFGNYPFLIVGEQSGYYKVKTDTPIVNGSPLFSGTYDWTQTNGYILKSQINVINNNNYKNPTGTSSYGKFSNHIDQASISSSGVYLYGWAFAEGIDISKNEYVTKEIVLTNSQGTEVQRVKANNIYNEGFASAYSGPYQYARYSQTLKPNSLSNGIYYLNVSFKTSNYETYDSIKSNNVIDTGQIRIGNKSYRVYNSQKGGQLILQVSDFNGQYLNHVDQARLSSKGLYLYGWAFTQGLDMSTDSNVKKTIILSNMSNQEVKRITANNIYNEGFATAYNGPYQYARYEGMLQLSDLAVGTYSLNIQLETSDYSKIAALQSNYAIDSGTYPIGNKVYRIYNTGKGTSLKLEVSNITPGNQKNHVDTADISSKGLELYGWSFIENLDMSSNGNVQKTIIFKNSSNQVVKKEVVQNYFHQGFAEAYRAPYQYARYKDTLDLSDLAVGSYTLDINVDVSGVSKTSALQSNYAIDSGNYQIGNKVYRIYNTGKGTALKLEVSNSTSGNQKNHVDTADISSKGLELYGWSFIENLDMSSNGNVQKTIIFKNSSNQVVKKEVVQNYFHQGFAEAYRAPYQYARYKDTLDLSDLAVGSYTLDINVDVSGVSKTSALQSNYAIDSGNYQIGNKVYRIYNTGKGTALKLEISLAAIKNTFNHVDKAEFNSNGLYLYGWAYTEGLDMSNDAEIKKTIIFTNEKGQEVKKEIVRNYFHQGFADAYRAPYEYARYEQTLDISSLSTGTYTIEIQVQGQNSNQTVYLSSNYSIDTGKCTVGNKTYRLYNNQKGTALKLVIN